MPCKIACRQNNKTDLSVCVCLPTALYSIHKKKVYGAKMLESQNLQTLKSKYVAMPESKIMLFFDSVFLLVYWLNTLLKLKSPCPRFICLFFSLKLLLLFLLLLQSFHYLGAAPHQQLWESALQTWRSPGYFPWQPWGPGYCLDWQTGRCSACQSNHQGWVPGGEEHGTRWVWPYTHTCDGQNGH